ncbi:MAG: enzyme of heme biosynthesis [Methylococcaceae bacterium]|nr:enzyme of heme biosynthesis [Methylococcaceae bacterium]
MAELGKEQQQIDAKSIRQKRSWGWVWIFLVLLGLLALGALIFYFDVQHQGQQKGLTEKVTAELTQKNQQMMELTQQISGYQTQIAAIQSQLANVQQASSGKDSHFDQALDDFSKLYTEKLDVTRNELKTSIDQVQRLLGKTRSDWMIADAEYLLSVANQRLLLMGDVATAKQAMEAADARLRESEDTAVFKVREQLVKEIAELSKVSVLDVVGLYAKITALQQAANKLTFILPYVGKQDKSPEPAQAKVSDETEGGLIDKALVSMKDIVSIKHSAVPVAGIISKEEAQFSLQQIKVRLDMVKMSLLQQNEVLYLASISDVKQWLNENFTQNAAGNDFLKQLNELAGIKIRSQLPTISDSLNMLKAITKMRVETDKVLPKVQPEIKTPVAGPTPTNKPEPVKSVPDAPPVVVAPTTVPPVPVIVAPATVPAKP